MVKSPRTIQPSLVGRLSEGAFASSDESSPEVVATENPQRTSSYSRKVGALLWILAPLVLASKFGHLFTLHSLNENRLWLCTWSASHEGIVAVSYILIMTLVIGLTVPGATSLSFAGGVIFPQPRAAIYAYLGFVLGASASYFAVRTLLSAFVGNWLKSVSGYHKLEKKLKENAFMYLIAARFTLVFPFWFVNGTAAMVGVPFRVFFGSTALAVIPGSIIYTTAGRALSTILDTLDEEGVKNLSTSELLYQTIISSVEMRVCLVLVVLVGVVSIAIKNFIPSNNRKTT